MVTLPASSHEPLPGGTGGSGGRRGRLGQPSGKAEFDLKSRVLLVASHVFAGRGFAPLRPDEELAVKITTHPGALGIGRLGIAVQAGHQMFPPRGRMQVNLYRSAGCCRLKPGRRAGLELEGQFVARLQGPTQVGCVEVDHHGQSLSLGWSRLTASTRTVLCPCSQVEKDSA